MGRRRYKRKGKGLLTRHQKTMALLHDSKFDNEKMEDARKSLLLAFVRGNMSVAQKKYAEVLAKPLWAKVKMRKKEQRGAKHFVYGISDGSHLKIGYANDAQRRLADLQVGNPNHLEIKGLIECPNRQSAKRMERQMHKACWKHQVRGEWFSMDAMATFGGFALATAVDELGGDIYLVEEQ